MSEQNEEMQKKIKKKWMTSVRGALLKRIREKIESDPIAMRKVGVFLATAGVSLVEANIFALEIACKMAYTDSRVKEVKPEAISNKELSKIIEEDNEQTYLVHTN